jgi:hypothetical protein
LTRVNFAAFKGGAPSAGRSRPGPELSRTQPLPIRRLAMIPAERELARKALKMMARDVAKIPLNL